MQRFVLLTALAFTLSLPVFAQAPPPAQPAKYIPPVKGVATIEVLQTPSKRVGNEMVTVIKVRNTSKGSINLLKADEYWYDKNTQIVSGSQYSHKKAPIKPGEIVEITLRAPIKPGMLRNQTLFRHAYGEVKATAVKTMK